MKEELELLLQQLKDVAEERHNEGNNLRHVSNDVSEWNYGYSEGVEYAIEMIENLINRTQVDTSGNKGKFVAF